MKIDILGVGIDNVTMAQATQRGRAMLAEEGFSYVVTPNPEFILDAQKNSDFARVLNGADMAVPDGIGVVYAAKILGTPLTERVPGIELGSAMLEALHQMGGRLYLLGAKPGVAQLAGERILAQYPNIVLCGCHDGYFKEDEAPVAEISAAQPDLLFVCLGAPRQEQWMEQYGPQTGAKLALGLGGAMDVFAGQVQRAPEGWQRLGLEWAYRLVKEPKRITRMARLPLILWKAALVRLFGGKK